MRNWHGNLSPFGKWHTSSYGALSAYAAYGFEPPLVLDFDESYFRTDGTATDLVSAATHTRAGNATMVDSDGVLKWAPHNLVENSTTYGNKFASVDTIVTNNTTDTLDPDGGSTAAKYEAGATAAKIGFAASGLRGIKDTHSLWAKAGTCRYIGMGDSSISPYAIFDLVGGVVTTSSSATASISDAGNGWYLCSYTPTGVAGSFYCVWGDSDGVSTGWQSNSTTAGETYYLWGHHAYRSDLGGMVDNPATGDSYVPTTDAARFLPRVGHHIWNGSAWVDEGYFHESEARTNLITYSDMSSGFTEVAMDRLGAQEVGPDGQNSLSLYTVTTATSAHTVSTEFITSTAAAVYTQSIVVKKGTLQYLGLRQYGQENVWATAVFDLNALSVSATGVGDSSGNVRAANVESLGNGLYRLSMSSSINRTSFIFNVQAHSSGTPTLNTFGGESYTGASETFYAGFAQSELGPTPSSLIATNGATVTRAADAMTIPAANLPWNPLAVSIQMEGTMTYADTGTSGSGSGGSGDAVFYYWHINAGNYIESFLATNNDQDLISFAQESSGVRDVVNLFFGPTPGINVPFNIASRHGSTFINGAVDGTALTADLTPTALPYLENTDMQIGSTFNGTIKLFRMWADDLTDEGITTGTIADNAFSVSGGYFLTADGEYLIVEET